MTSILVTCVKNFGKFPERIIFSWQKKVTNFVIQRYVGDTGNFSRRVLPRSLTEQTRIAKSKIPITLQKIHENVINNTWLKKRDIENIIDSIVRADDIRLNEVVLLLQACNNIVNCMHLQKIQIGNYLWETLTICNVQLRVDHYNTLLQLYVENDHNFSPVDILLEMHMKMIYPDNITYQTCIEYYCKRGDISLALNLVKEMEILNMPITETVYNSLLKGYSHLGDEQNVINTLNNMKKNKIKETAEVYTAVMCTYAKTNDINKIKEIIQSCSSKNMSFSNKNILDVIYTLVTNHHKNNIKTMFQYIQKVSRVSNNDIQLILKFINIREAETALYICLHMFSKILMNPEFQEVMELILQNVVYNSTNVDDIFDFCALLVRKGVYPKPLLGAVYYSFLRDDDCFCLPLLSACKAYYTIKPHYFWPLMIKQAMKYDFKGILNLLQIMIYKFNVMPCIVTITDYVLPFSFGKESDIRTLLTKYNINKTTINNAFVASMLRLNKLRCAEGYMRFHQGSYFYSILANDLRTALIFRKDVESFVKISYDLLNYNFNNNTAVPVSMDRQLLDFMINYPTYKKLLAQVVLYLAEDGVKLSSESIERILIFLHEYATNDVRNALKRMSKSMKAESHLTNILYHIVSCRDNKRTFRMEQMSHLECSDSHKICTFCFAASDCRRL